MNFKYFKYKLKFKVYTMKDLNNLEQQLKVFKDLYIKSYNYYNSLTHVEKMNSDIIYTLNIIKKRIKNIQLNINQQKQKCFSRKKNKNRKK